jgi:hypothetical protein
MPMLQALHLRTIAKCLCIDIVYRTVIKTLDWILIARSLLDV